MSNHVRVVIMNPYRQDKMPPYPTGNAYKTNEILGDDLNSSPSGLQGDDTDSYAITQLRVRNFFWDLP